ncbi:MAG: NAD(P)/FAD-dependent oxidoreductase [Phototrophicaceae bacterium]
MTQHTDIFIVGAGISGLTLANLLTHYGLSYRIIDCKSVHETSQNIILQARTLEALNVIGITKAIRATGKILTAITVKPSDTVMLNLNFTELEDTAYPYMLMVQQSQLEAMLIKRLEKNSITVERKKTLTDFMPSENGVTLTIEQDNGTIEIATASYLIGADGADGMLRQLLGIHQQQDKAAWTVVNIALNRDFPQQDIFISSHHNGLISISPLASTDATHVQIAYAQNDALIEQVTLESLQALMIEAGFDWDILAILGDVLVADGDSSQVEAYRHGQVLLLGDAAHGQIPFLTQDLNLSILDAFNLAWKLAMVVRGKSSERLLDSYQEERHPIGQQVQRSVDRLLSALVVDNSPIKRSVRNALLPMMARFQPVKHRLIDTLSQLGHHYKDATTVRGQDGNLRAGQRLPNYPYVDIGGTTDLYTHLDNTKHTLLMVGDTNELSDLAELIQKNYGSTVVPRIIDTQPVSNAPCPILVDVSGLIPLKPHLAYLIRPDQMIGLVSTIAEMRAGAQQLFG